MLLQASRSVKGQEPVREEWSLQRPWGGQASAGFLQGCRREMRRRASWHQKGGMEFAAEIDEDPLGGCDGKKLEETEEQAR